MAHKGGPISKLDGHKIAEAAEYVDGPEGNELMSEATRYLQECADTFTKKKTVVQLPTIEGLAYFLGVSRSTLSEWETQNTKFAFITERLRQKQIVQLINESLSGRYKSPKTVGMMLAKHGYYEKTETEHSGSILRSASDEELDAIIERAERRQTSQDPQA